MARILVADDDPQIRATIRTLLLYMGFEVTTTEDSGAIMQALVADEYDLVILDIFMPGLEGLETIRALRRRFPDTPIIAMSGVVFPERRVATPDFLAMATKLGATASLHKPFAPHDLLVAVEACVSSTLN
jgi:CheY-like chemotaxis protein